MRRTFAIASRILSQFAHDPRTLALLFIAPIIVLWLLSVLLNAEAVVPTVATVDLPEDYQAALAAQEVEILDVDAEEAEELLRAGEVDAVLRMADDETLDIWLEGSDQTRAASVASVAAAALSDLQASSMEELAEALASLGLASSSDDSSTSISSMQTSYLHGSEDWAMPDFYGPIFIGVFLFAFTFLTSGMSLVNERSKGTMARFLATPVKPVEILGGYSLGFGALALVQSAVILVAGLGFIGFPNEGSLALVVFVAVSLAITSVTLGLLVSGLASNAFQVIQLMLLFVMPQIVLCGLFDLSGTPGWLQALSWCFPVTYGVDALQAVMLRGAGLADIAFELVVVWAFIAVFFVLAALGFRKKRAPRVRPARGEHA